MTGPRSASARGMCPSLCPWSAIYLFTTAQTAHAHVQQSCTLHCSK